MRKVRVKFSRYSQSGVETPTRISCRFVWCLSLLNSVYSVDRHTQTLSAALSRESWLVVTRHRHTHTHTAQQCLPLLCSVAGITLWNCLARYTFSSQPVFLRLWRSVNCCWSVSSEQAAVISNTTSWYVSASECSYLSQYSVRICLDDRSSISDGNRLCPDLPRGPPSLLCSGHRRVKLTAERNAFTRPRFSVALYSYRVRLGPPSVL
jgi:hypothetical protein